MVSNNKSETAGGTSSRHSRDDAESHVHDLPLAFPVLAIGSEVFDNLLHYGFHFGVVKRAQEGRPSKGQQPPAKIGWKAGWPRMEGHLLRLESVSSKELDGRDQHGAE